MHPAFLARFRPAGPWRFGPDSGARDRVDPICHSDTLYSALSAAMARLGVLEEWFAATVPFPAIRLSSLFPYQGDLLFIAPPRSLWPPATSSRVRWAGARFVPVNVVELLLTGKTLEEENWLVDGASDCLVPAGGRFRGAGPFRVSLRSSAAVDRLGAGVEPHLTACLEFAEEAGMWGLVEFTSAEVKEQWGHRVRSALRLLADCGIGGERSRGWGRSAMPSIREGLVPELLFRSRGAKENGEPLELAPESEGARWLLSLYSPAPDDAVNWRLGNYQMTSRSGRVESPASSGDLKKSLRMVTEGSVLVSPAPLKGAVRDVAPDGFPHPVYRAGFAVSVPIRWGKPVPPPPPPPVEEAKIVAAPVEEPPPEVVEPPLPEPAPQDLSEPAETEPPVETTADEPVETGPPAEPAAEEPPAPKPEVAPTSDEPPRAPPQATAEGEEAQ